MNANRYNFIFVLFGLFAILNSGTTGSELFHCYILYMQLLSCSTISDPNMISYITQAPQRAPRRPSARPPNLKKYARATDNRSRESKVLTVQQDTRLASFPHGGLQESYRNNSIIIIPQKSKFHHKLLIPKNLAAVFTDACKLIRSYIYYHNSMQYFSISIV